MAVPDALKKIMYHLHISQTELAHMTGLTKSSVSYYMRKKRSPSCATVRHLLHFAKKNGVHLKFQDFVNGMDGKENDPITQTGK